jgi:pyruvate kinase
MIKMCNESGKPVIVATQMLESMSKNPRPTRAEVADVTNAVHDGADCVMLSGETAKGSYPIETVEMMQRIIQASESFDDFGMSGSNAQFKYKGKDGANSVAQAAVAASKSMGARCIIVLTKTGRTARLISSYRPTVPIICYTPSHKVGRQLQIFSGCHPIVDTNLITGLADLKNHQRGEEAIKISKECGFLEGGDSYVLVRAEKRNGVKTLGMRIGTLLSEE